jgi:integrase
MALTDQFIKRAEAKAKAYKLSDDKGLFLLVKPTGAKYWRFKYRIKGKEKLLALGVYPEVSLANARAKLDEARKLLANDVDPGALRKEAKQEKVISTEHSFEIIAREWHERSSSIWSEKHTEKIMRRFERDVFPVIGALPITEITAPILLDVLRRIEARGVVETAHRTHQNCSQVFRYAIATGRAVRDPSPDLRGALRPMNKKHHAAIVDPKEIAPLLRAMQGYTGAFVTKCALLLAPLVFVRPGELRHAEWSEIDFENAEWRIPAAKMKMGEQHIVPLSRQAIAILKEVQPYTGENKYVFPCNRTPTRPMSENTVNGALRRLGYTSDEMTGHGFRSMACTILNEQNWNRDAIERQLAHAERDNVRAAYHHAEYLPERRRMMQAWADYLDGLIKGGL